MQEIHKNVCVCVLGHFSHVQLFAAVWTAARQAPLSIGLSRQEYWSGLSCPPAGALPHPGKSSTSPALAGRFFTASVTWEAPHKNVPNSNIHNSCQWKQCSCPLIEDWGTALVI